MNTLYFSDRSTQSGSPLLFISANCWLRSWMIQFSGKTNKAWQIQIIVCRWDKVIMRKCIRGNWSFFEEGVWFSGDPYNSFLCVLPLMGGGWNQRLCRGGGLVLRGLISLWCNILISPFERGILYLIIIMAECIEKLSDWLYLKQTEM